MTPPPETMLEAARRIVGRKAYWLRNADREDLVGIIVAGGLAAQAPGRWSWHLFRLAGLRDLYCAIRASKRKSRDRFHTVSLVDYDPTGRDVWGPVDDRLTVNRLLLQVDLSPMEREALEHLYRDGDMWGNTRRQSNGMNRALRKLKRAAGTLDTGSADHAV